MRVVYLINTQIQRNKTYISFLGFFLFDKIKFLKSSNSPDADV